MVQITDGHDQTANISKGMLWHANFGLICDDNLPPNETVHLTLELVNGQGRQWHIPFALHKHEVEDFETADLQSFEWKHTGQFSWSISDEQSPDGIFSVRSGGISHQQSSELYIDWMVALDDSISFFVHTSTEPHFDRLKFAVNGIEWDCWTGNTNWTHVVYKVNAGQKRFSWIYEKDVDNSTAEDAAWIDFVVFPRRPSPTGLISIAEQGISMAIYPNPARDKVYIDLRSDKLTYAEVRILDATGRFVYTRAGMKLAEGNYQIMLTTDQLQAGIYTVVVLTTTGSVAGKLIILPR
jgi:hypothetical protein